MVLQTDETPEQLRINVCSPGGTTIEAVNKLQEKCFEEIIGEAFDAAAVKSRKMER
jgi:pyrroline-5-carboxylate reductase